jgi:peptidoglycan/LPS O-acetylase OafA/YrhL
MAKFYQTLQTTLESHKGVGPGFDLLRIGLAVAIFYGHAKYVAGSSVGPAVVADALVQKGFDIETAGAAAFDWSFWGSFKRVYHLALVPMFFALSGFLVAGSALRARALKPFLAFRALRIFPALSVEVILSAVLLGPMFTTLALSQYFTDPGFFRYFGNIFGFVDMFLPRVFAANPVPSIVNINLWTLPAEFYCYLLTASLIVTGLFFRRAASTLLVAAVTAAFLVASYTNQYGVTLRSLYDTPVVVYYFFVGSLFYHWQHRIPFGWAFFATASTAAAVALAFPQAVFVAPIFLTYATVFLGAVSWPKLPLIQKGDYSYGVYLYGFPISQALIAVIPVLRGHENLFALLAGLLTITFAVVSWHLIEKPTLSLKRHFSKKSISQSPDKRADIAAVSAKG